MDIKITWLGHSCFAVEKDDYRIIFDPYEDGAVPGLPALKEEADKVLCSHGHGDHGAAEVISIRKDADKKVCPFTIEEIHSFHDDAKGTKRGPNTIFILSDGEYRIAHMGDIGCFPTPEQMEKLKDLTVMLVPVGGFYTMEPGDIHRLVNELEPQIVVPMHYRSDKFGYDVIAELSKYTDACDDVVIYDGPDLMLPEDGFQQTAVLGLL